MPLIALFLPSVAFATSVNLIGMPWFAILVISLFIAFIKSFKYKGPKHIGFLSVVLSVVGPIILYGFLLELNVYKFSPPYGWIIFLISGFAPLFFYYSVIIFFSKHTKGADINQP